jgi:hypothetical protein
MTDTDYDKAKERIEDFLRSYYTEDESNGLKTFKYWDQIRRLAERKQLQLYVEQDDLNVHDPELSEWVDGNTIRYRQLFNEVMQKLVQEVLGDEQVSFLMR